MGVAITAIQSEIFHGLSINPLVVMQVITYEHGAGTGRNTVGK